MSADVTTIVTTFAGIQVNCYLVHLSRGGFLLIDAGVSTGRKQLVNALENAGCRPGDLKAVLLTHSDPDHAGNCAFLQAQYGAKVAIHPADAINVTSGDMFANKHVSPFARKIFSWLMYVIPGGRIDRFEPDIYLEDGQELIDLGFEARILHLPGHSPGSVSILTAAGDLFCGDLLSNTKSPAVNSLVDDAAQMKTSIERLRDLSVQTVYPGHGGPFLMKALNPNFSNEVPR